MTNNPTHPNPKEALLEIKSIVESYGDSKAVGSYYLEFWRRVEVLSLVDKYCSRGSLVVDLGAQPFILSCALAKMGYRVIAVDIEPESYAKIAETCRIDVLKLDLERDVLPSLNADCAVFSEVIEHLSYYTVPQTLASINRTLRNRGILVLTTPNIASLFRRLKLLIGKQPQYRYHQREYTMDEIVTLLTHAGFNIVEKYFSLVNDRAFMNAEKDEYLTLNSYGKMLKITFKRPTPLNILRVVTYPILRVVPSLRMLIVIIAQKVTEPINTNIERWG